VPGREAEWRSEFRGTLAAAGWRPIAGQWRFANDSLLQEDPTGFDSAVVYRASAFADYSYRASFRQRDGNGAGLLFNLPDPDSLAGGHMVRYSDRRPGGIFWGYYEADGKFVGQGYANVAPPGDVSHTLRVVSRPETYAIYLDDFLLATDVPLRSKSGYVGLVTVQTAAEFDSAAVGAPDGTMVGTGAAGGSGDETGTASGALAGAAGAGTLGTDIPAEAAATVAGTGEAGTGQAPLGALPRAAPGIYRGELGFPSQTTVSGKWMVEDGVFRQTAPDPADYILNTGIAAADYTLAADVLLANKPEVGGGFLLQAPERGRKAGATVVRFTNGGESLFWGVYDEAGTFRGRQAVDLPQKPEGETGYVLRVEVRGNTLDVYVDGEQVIAGAVLPQTQGYLGLLAFGGPVTFANVEITVRQAGAAP
jgi:hypothetical protein